MAKKKQKQQRSSSEESTGMWIALVLAVVAVVGLVLLYNDMSVSGGAVVTGLNLPSPAGLGDDRQTGWDLGAQLANRWDGTEVDHYCDFNCGNVCARALSSMGKPQDSCFRSCQSKCQTDILANNYDTTKY